MRDLIVLIVVGGTCLRAQGLFEPWVGSHNAWGGAHYGTIARKLPAIRHWQTRFAAVANGGDVAVADFEYYYHYPPLLVWLDGTLLEKLRIRTSFPRVAPSGEAWSKLGLALHLTRDLVRMYYPPILVLIAVRTGIFARDWMQNRLQDGDWCVLILLVYGLLNALAFPSILPGHDYMSRCDDGKSSHLFI